MPSVVPHGVFFVLLLLTFQSLSLVASAARLHQSSSVRRAPSTCTPYTQTSSQCAAQSIDNAIRLHDAPSSWVDIQGAGDASQVYSAYRMSATLVRAVTILSRNATKRVFCYLMDGERGEVSDPAVATIRILKFDENKPYVVAYVECAAREASRATFLALATREKMDGIAEPGRKVPIFDLTGKSSNDQRTQHAETTLPATTSSSSTPPQNSCFGVCVRVYGGSPHTVITARDVAEFVEHHRHLGFGHFTFYTTAVADDVARALAFYQSAGTVTVHKFEPRVAPTDIHELGQVAVINDCHLRNRGLYTLFLQADVDEFVVPRDGVGLIDHLQSLLASPARPVEIGLLSSFIYVAKNDTQRLRTTAREVMIYPYTWRSKYIALTADVEEAGIHELFKTTRGEAPAHRHVLPSATAVLHHYRRADVQDGVVVNDIPSIVGQAKQQTLEDATMVAHLARYEACVGDVVAAAARIPARLHKFVGRVGRRRRRVGGVDDV